MAGPAHDLLDLFMIYRQCSKRHGVWSGIYFGSIGYIKSSPVMAYFPKTKNGDLWGNFVAGCLGGTLGTFVS